jgi:V/A-type H+-transporting ATPase subunit I
MNKVWLIVLDRERRAALAGLRSLGVLHVEEIQGHGTEHDNLVRQLASAEKAIGILSTVKSEGKGTRKDRQRGKEVIRGTLEATERIRQLHEESAVFQKEYERVRDWGDFDPEDVSRLTADGFCLKAFECPAQRLQAVSAELPILRLSAPKGKARFVTVRSSRTGSSIQADTASLAADFEEFSIPSMRASELEERIASAKKRVIAESEHLSALSIDISCAEHEKNWIISELKFETIRSGMESTGEVAHISGFVPVSKLPDLKREAKKHGWGLASDEPSADELPPTKIENSPLVRLIEPVFEFLGTVPNYREYDISAWFLGFFGSAHCTSY